MSRIGDLTPLATHEGELRAARPLVERFLEESAGLGDKRGPLLLQLPPSLAFDRRVAGRFLDLLRSRFGGPLVCEPRHPTWFAVAAEALLVRHAARARALIPATIAAGGTRPARPSRQSREIRSASSGTIRTRTGPTSNNR